MAGIKDVIRYNRFSYKRGPIQTTTPWLRPDPENLNNWKKQFFYEIGDIKNYKLWICGGLLEDRPTWDVDLVVTGEVQDKELLQNILIKSTNIGFENRLLVDAFWSGDWEPYFEQGEMCKGLQIACENTVFLGHCDGTKCLQPRRMKGDFIVVSPKVFKNDRLISEYKGAKRIHQHLWMIEGDPNRPTPVHRKEVRRYNETQFNNTSPILLTSRTNFYDYVDWP